jgi:dTDP-3-amino-2,3,6-trideoxy-4-keto-D-glucose/dTDP-3-amino-3,4,6-trideoxy-alpha-D-glucose/dTDP-2,6-dideoxy-D-kanosamine transaminase
MLRRIPLNDVSRPARAIGHQQTRALDRVLKRGWYILGPENEAFEQAFAAYCGVNHAIGVANGTDAIELALRALGVQAGQAVATVGNAGFYATTALLAIGAVPIFVDVDPDTQLMSLDALRRAVHVASPQCVVVTHLYGRLADVEEIIAVCAARGIPVIEDCAQAHGARRGNRRAGSFGAAGCFSFYPTKNLGALGDGGAVVTRDLNIANRVRSLRQYGWDAKYRITRRHGRNSRLDEIQAAVLHAKLPYLDDWNSHRRDIARRYTSEISHPGVKCPTGFGDDHVAHLYVIRCENRDGLRRHLESAGIATEIHYPIPDHHQPAFHFSSTSLPVTERLADEVLTLPCFPEMTDDEITGVIRAVNAW